jgi:hypothetical protein
MRRISLSHLSRKDGGEGGAPGGAKNPNFETCET